MSDPANSTSAQTRHSPSAAAERSRLLRGIRICLLVVIAGLVASGVTAFPLREELALVRDALARLDVAAVLPEAVGWVDRVSEGLDAVAATYPFIAYGTDWLAFAHLLIAVAFVGPLRDPVRNVWVTVWGLVACAGIVPLALIAGTLRGLPWGVVADRHVVRSGRGRAAGVRVGVDAAARTAHAERGGARPIG